MSATPNVAPVKRKLSFHPAFANPWLGKSEEKSASLLGTGHPANEHFLTEPFTNWPRNWVHYNDCRLIKLWHNA